MESSRIFVKGLPPTFTDEQFRKHFAQQSAVTDAKIFPNRRIGFIGYKTVEEAKKAVKYFNKTFIRMSRIGVELARSPQDAKDTNRLGLAPAVEQRSSDKEYQVAPENNLKRKWTNEPSDEADPKLKEFLEVMKPKSKKAAWERDDMAVGLNVTQKQDEVSDKIIMDGASDDEYEVVPNKTQRSKHTLDPKKDEEAYEPDVIFTEDGHEKGAMDVDADQEPRTTVTDKDWARSRTSRLLGLLDEDEEETVATRERQEQDADDAVNDEIQPISRETQLRTDAEVASLMPTRPSDDQRETVSKQVDTEPEIAESSMRLFVRNLPYDVKMEELEAFFAPFGNLEEVHIPLDKRTGSGKGFALLQFSNPDSASKALTEKDGHTFQGRLLHVLPGSAKRESKLDEFELSKLPLKKQQQIKKRREAESTTFNWNALYMNADAVVSSVADRLGLQKSEVLDPTSSDAAVKQAHAETHIIQETKAYFKQQGIDLDAFKGSHRGDTAILVKNIPYDCSKDDLKRLFEEHGDVKRFVMPPSGVIAIVEYNNSAQCKAGFGALAYRKIKNSVLFLEKAPKNLFNAPSNIGEHSGSKPAISTTSASDLKDADLTVPDAAGTATLFVRNLNFTTDTPLLTETFKPLDGFMSARVKTKTDARKPGQVLSMGFGFLEFRSSQHAQAALRAMDGYILEGHKLQIRASHKGVDAAEDRRKADAAKREAGKKTKVIIKNLPFEATKKDVRALFGAYGQLRSVRVPKKMDRGARGFAFADFTTPKEAESAMGALKDTHLLGRRLILDYAAGDPEDAEAEIEKMQQKVGAQVNKVALQKLTSGGRKKFTTVNNEEMDEA